MRLISYLNFCPINENINKFRALTIQLVENPSIYHNLINETSRKFSLPSMSKTLISLNYELKKVYNGKLSFDFCLDEGKPFDALKLKRNHYQKIKLLYLEANDQLSNHKKLVENQIHLY